MVLWVSYTTMIKNAKDAQNDDTGRVLAIDPGAKRIGIARSDPSRSVAFPLAVLTHKSLLEDCQGILDLCQTNQVTLILVGIALSEDGVENPAMRHAQKVADKLRELTIIPVLLWDESGSTRQVKLDSLAAGVKRKDRHGHLDKNAAAVILRSYLERDVHEDTN